jgi:hypothetical protein
MQRLVKEEQILRLDNFALFDAVAKRGYSPRNAEGSSR